MPPKPTAPYVQIIPFSIFNVLPVRGRPTSLHADSVLGISSMELPAYSVLMQPMPFNAVPVRATIIGLAIYV
jgi:hypothetical protein